MSILVTGATGFIGRHLIRRLFELDETVYCLVRDKEKAAWLLKYNVKLFEGDITAPITLKRFESMDIHYIFHCAALVDFKKRDELFETNRDGTRNICDLALKLNLTNLVYLSSIATVSGGGVDKLTDSTPYAASDPYGESKIEAEKIVLEYREQHNLRASILRPPMVYGADEPHLYQLLMKAMRWRLFPLFGKAQNRLHLAYVETVVDAMLYSMNHHGFLRRICYIADEDILSVEQLMGIWQQATHSPRPFRIPEWLCRLIARFPGAQRYLRWIRRDLELDQSTIKSLGFKHRYKTETVLFESARDVLKKSH